MSKNAEGWIRHRGGKCPVGKGVFIDVRHRDGQIIENVPALLSEWACEAQWAHDTPHKARGEIMAYRLHKPAEQAEPFIEAVHAFNALAKVPQLDGPLQWRDRITTIDFDIHSLTTERAELVQKLASEGFALIVRVAEPVEDMSDWRNWKAGDIVRYEGLPDFHSKYFTIGNLYEIKLVETGDDCKNIYNPVIFKADDSGEENGWRPELFKFHSRPSA